MSKEEMKNQKSCATSHHERSCESDQVIENVIKNVLCFTKVGFTLEEILDCAKLRFALPGECLKEKMSLVLNDLIKNRKIIVIGEQPSERFQLVRQASSNRLRANSKYRNPEKMKKDSIEFCSSRARNAVSKYFEKKTIKYRSKEALISPRCGNSLGNKAVDTYIFGSVNDLGVFSNPVPSSKRVCCKNRQKQGPRFKVKTKMEKKLKTETKLLRHQKAGRRRLEPFKNTRSRSSKVEAKVSQKQERRGRKRSNKDDATGRKRSNKDDGTTGRKRSNKDDATTGRKRSNKDDATGRKRSNKDDATGRKRSNKDDATTGRKRSNKDDTTTGRKRSDWGKKHKIPCKKHCSIPPRRQPIKLDSKKSRIFGRRKKSTESKQRTSGNSRFSSARKNLREKKRPLNSQKNRFGLRASRSLSKKPHLGSAFKKYRMQHVSKLYKNSLKRPCSHSNPQKLPKPKRSTEPTNSCCAHKTKQNKSVFRKKSEHLKDFYAFREKRKEKAKLIKKESRIAITRCTRREKNGDSVEPSNRAKNKSTAADLKIFRSKLRKRALRKLGSLI